MIFQCSRDFPSYLPLSSIFSDLWYTVFTSCVAALFEFDRLDSDMSEFDKEAEREKLRKQFEEDEKRREGTERMSELLLKGATMTNRHCETCGDPIFRYQGQEFCPTCQMTVEGQETHSPEERQPDATSTANPDATNIEIDDSRTDESGATTDAESSPEPEPSTTADPTPDPEPTPRPPQQPARHGQRSETDLDEARQSLVRTVTRFAAQAEGADDIGRAREFLAATEEAADALRAVNRTE